MIAGWLWYLEVNSAINALRKGVKYQETKSSAISFLSALQVLLTLNTTTIHTNPIRVSTCAIIDEAMVLQMNLWYLGLICLLYSNIYL